MSSLTRTVLLAFLVLASDIAEGQQRSRGRRPRTAPARTVRTVADGTIHINYPDGVNLAVLVDFVSQKLDLRIVYEDELRGQSVVVRPGEFSVPRGQLLEFLRGLLRMHDLVLIDGEIDGWLQIVRADDFHRHVSEIRRDRPSDEGETTNRVVTQLVEVRSNEPSAIIQHVERFLSSSKASIIEVPGQQLLIVTDYESGLTRVLEMIALVDVAPREAVIESIAITHYGPQVIADYLSQVLDAEAKLEGRDKLDVTIRPDVSNEKLLLVGTGTDVAYIKELTATFDVAPQARTQTRVYSPRYISVARLQQVLEVFLRASLRSTTEHFFLADEDRNRLYVTAPTSAQQRIAALVAQEDVPLEKEARPMKIYKPQNRSAGDLIAILSEVLPNVAVSTTAIDAAAESSLADGAAQQEAVLKPVGQASAQVGAVREPLLADAQVRRVEGEDFVLSFDEHTNSLIAVGSNEFHDRLTGLLVELDKRQSQVLIEVTLVAITFNDSFSFAVELASEEKFAELQSLIFSSFGISDIDLGTGARSLNPGGGINAIILGPFETPIVIRAIAAHGNSRVIATPRILVANNTSATISSVEEAPFTSINASDTVATTSFAGFESAGTSLTVTPSVIETQHLGLDYSFSFSNFNGQGSVGVPPPRTTNSFTGRIEIPNDHTAVIGGLVTENETDTVTEVPIVGRIPIIGALFQSSDRIRTKSRIYAFIKPTILRDDEFADLKLITQREIERAELINSDFPQSEWLSMR